MMMLPFVSRDRLERKTKRRDLDRHLVVGDDGRAGVARILEIDQQHRDGTCRVEAKDTPLKRERIEKRADGVRDEIRFARIDVNEPEFGCVHGAQLRADRKSGAEQEKE